LRQPAEQHRSDEAHTQPADGAGLDVARKQPRLVGFGEQNQRRLAERNAGRGEANALAVAINVTITAPV
jgi:hypothetical protein